MSLGVISGGKRVVLVVIFSSVSGSETSHGGPDRIRTYDARFRKPSLYPLSYGAIAFIRYPRNL